jgi:hypothetical protein
VPKCPKCEQEIDRLVNWSSSLHKYLFTIDKKGDADYEELDEVVGDINDYECPECWEVLFSDEQDAITFLQGSQ